MRLLITAGLLAVGFCIPFVIWGGDFLHWFSGEAIITWLRARGAWSGVAIIGLLMSDLFLPVPATAVMAASGYLHGPLIGGFLNSIGSFGGGLLGYAICRQLGRRIAIRLVGEKELEQQKTFFQRNGPWLVALSRWLPLLPEVISCLAGLAHLPVRIFVVALACGSIPPAFVYAAIGVAGQNRPILALSLSIALPLLLFAIARPFLRR